MLRASAHKLEMEGDIATKETWRTLWYETIIEDGKFSPMLNNLHSPIGKKNLRQPPIFESLSDGEGVVFPATIAWRSVGNKYCNCDSPS